MPADQKTKKTPTKPVKSKKEEDKQVSPSLKKGHEAQINSKRLEAITLLENLTKFIGSILAVSAGSGSVFYVIGLVVVNIYLASYGVRDFNLARITYLSSGISYFIFHIIPVVF